MLSRPQKGNIETVNDLDGFLINFWRAVTYADPLAIVDKLLYPVSEIDLYARHKYLKNEGKPDIDRLYNDYKYYDLDTACYWLWGISQWIGGDWCNLNNKSIHKKRPNLSDNGQGIVQKRLFTKETLLAYITALKHRTLNVRFCCGDWQRVLNLKTIEYNGLTSIFLDPPYSNVRDANLYNNDSFEISKQVYGWALEHGNNKNMRIAFCGYLSENYSFPKEWEVLQWLPFGGMANVSKKENTRGKENKYQEFVAFSPYCLKPERQATIFELME